MACYNLYLKGLHYAAKATSEGYQTALEAFSAALREDETFAKAHIGIAEIYVWLGYFSVLPPALVFPKAKEHAERALEIDDTLAEGWAALGNVSYNYDWDWAAADRSFQRALELNPKLVATLYSYSVFEQNMGRHAEALANAKLAADLSPLSPMVQANVGWRHYWAGDLEAAIESWKGVVELQSGLSRSPCSGWSRRTAIKGASRRSPQRWSVICWAPERPRSECSATSTGSRVVPPMPAACWRSSSAAPPPSIVGHYNSAFVHLGLGDHDRALELLHDAVLAREGLLFNLVARPFDCLRADRRFRALVKAIGLPLLDTVSSISGPAPAREERS